MRSLPFVVTLAVLAAVPHDAAAQAVTPTIAFGTRHAVALRTNGDVLTWGENVSCQLGRAAGNTNAEAEGQRRRQVDGAATRRSTNSSRTPGLVMRNAIAIAAAADHTLVLTGDGKVYGWGQNAEGSLGVGNTYDQCEGPAAVDSLAAHRITRIATGYGFSVAVTSDGDLYCSGDNSMGQCPVGRTGRAEVFTKVPLPDLAGTVADVRAGLFHTLIVTKDGRLYTLGRGRDGQLGTGRTTNGFGLVADMADVTSFAAGTWHSVAARADGSVWTWGNGAKGQLCDGGTANRSTPARVALPGGARVTQVAAGGHGTLLRTADGGLIACGDNQAGPLGVPDAVAATPTPIATAKASAVLGLGGAHAAITSDGCDVRLAGLNDDGVVAAAETPATAKTFAARANLSLCAPRSASPLGDVVNPAPRGGESGCWTTRVQEDAVGTTRFAGLRQAMLTVEEQLKKNAALMDAPQPVRWRTSIAAGPVDAGARMHVKAVPERKQDGTRLWSKGCEVIPQVDRIGGAIAQVSVFFNEDAQQAFINPIGTPPKRTGAVAGYPEYEGWILITKDGRVPWVPQTLAERLDVEGEKRKKALAEAKRRPVGLVAEDAAGGLPWLQKQVDDYDAYRASFTAEQLRGPAVWGDPTGTGKKRLDAELAAMRGQVPTAREARQAHMARVAPRLLEAMADFDLKNIQPGPAERAMHVKPDPTFPDPKSPNRIQVVAVRLSFGPKPAGAQADWQSKATAAFDLAALAALLQ
jgi:alpha-tubulin suppressor-like RCC1 family protein